MYLPGPGSRAGTPTAAAPLRRLWPARWLPCALVLTLGWNPLGSAAQSAPPPTDPPALTFDRALALSQERAASLAARGSALSSARFEQTASGRLPDPRLVVGIDNLPVSGPDAYSVSSDFMTMRRIGLMQEMPNAAKRLAQSNLAQARVDREQAMLRAEELAVRRETAVAWLTLYYAERRLAAFAAVEHESRVLQDTIAARVSSSQALPADALMARQDALMLADRRDELGRDIAKSRAALRRWIGDAAAAPLAGDPPVWSASAEHIREQLPHHAELSVFEPMKQMAQAEAQEAQADERGDWGWELVYSKRNPAYGDMVSFQLSFDLPLWSGTNQTPKRHAREQALARVQAEEADLLRRHAAEVDAQLAELDATERARDRLERSGLPLAEQRAALVLASYQSGRGDLAGVLSARRDLAEQRLRALDLRSQSAVLRAQLNYLSDAADQPEPARQP